MFTGTLFPKQKPAAAFLCNKRRALLAWEQGTGKTIISLAAAEKLLEVGKAKRVLVIGPGSFLWQWEDKIKEFTNSSVTLVTAKNNKAGKRTREYENHTTTYTLVPYSLFRRDYERLRDAAVGRWDIVICDEAQEFRNNQTKTHNLLKDFNREVNPRYRWALTGTSITNKLEDLYSILFWVEKTFLPPWPVFEERHIVRDSFKAICGYKDLKSLNIYLQHKVDRKTEKDMAGQLPKIRPQVHKLEQTKEYKNAQATLLNHLQTMVDNLEFDDEGNLKGSQRDSGVSKAFSAVRLALSGEVKLKYATKLIKDLTNENSSNKFVCFSFYKEPINQLAELLHEAGFNTYRFTGDEDSEAKRENVKQFHNDPRGVLLCSNAGAAGLDLPFANQLINLDVPFAFGTLDQRIKRIVRASSKFQTAVVHYLIMEDSMEEFYFMVVDRKGQLQAAVLDKSDIDEVVVRPMSLRQYLTGERVE